MVAGDNGSTRNRRIRVFGENGRLGQREFGNDLNAATAKGSNLLRSKGTGFSTVILAAVLKPDLPGMT